MFDWFKALISGTTGLNKKKVFLDSPIIVEYVEGYMYMYLRLEFHLAMRVESQVRASHWYALKVNSCVDGKVSSKNSIPKSDMYQPEIELVTLFNKS